MTKTKLKQIIEEEIQSILLEQYANLKVTSVGVGHDPEECSKYQNMYKGCSKNGSVKYPRSFYPPGWEHRVEAVKKAMKDSPTTWKIFGPVTAAIDWQILQLHRYMMTDYGPTGSDIKQIPQMFIGRVSQWSRRIARLDPLWQYAKEDEKKKITNNLKIAAKELISSIKDKMK